MSASKNSSRTPTPNRRTSPTSESRESNYTLSSRSQGPHHLMNGWEYTVPDTMTRPPVTVDEVSARASQPTGQDQEDNEAQEHDMIMGAIARATARAQALGIPQQYLQRGSPSGTRGGSPVSRAQQSEQSRRRDSHSQNPSVGSDAGRMDSPSGRSSDSGKERDKKDKKKDKGKGRADGKKF